MGILGKYSKDNSGQFAIMFALATMALLLFVGVAIDYTGATSAKTKLQTRTDAAVLAAAKLRTNKIGQLRKEAKMTIATNNTEGQRINTKVSVIDNIIRVEATTIYSTRLMGIFGKRKIEISSVSEAPVPEDVPLNIVLVLDSTGSMDGVNMTALKSASLKLVEVFDEADPDTDIRVGIVPYAQYVNIGMSNRNQKWMDVPQDSETTLPETCSLTRDLLSPHLCSSSTNSSTCYNDSGEYPCERTSQSCPGNAYGPEYESCYIPTDSQTWNGCVGSRDEPNHLNPRYQGKKFPGIMNVQCGTEVLDLTNDMVSVKSTIANLSAGGSTYIPAGLSWGWRLLSPSLPLGGLTNNEARRTRAMVLMTDGANTVRLNAPYHKKDNIQEFVDEADKLTKELCEGIKSDNIELFTISYKLTTAAKSSANVVKECASSPSHYFTADNKGELEETFEEIAMSLYNIRLSK